MTSVSGCAEGDLLRGCLRYATVGMLRAVCQGVNASTALCPPAARYSYHVVTSAAPMPAKCWGAYQRVGLVEVDHHELPAGYTPSRIADVHGCRIIQTWERCNVGSTSACAVERAKAEARELADAHRIYRAEQAAEDAGERAA